MSARVVQGGSSGQVGSTKPTMTMGKESRNPRWGSSVSVTANNSSVNHHSKGALQGRGAEQRVYLREVERMPWRWFVLGWWKGRPQTQALRYLAGSGHHLLLLKSSGDLKWCWKWELPCGLAFTLYHGFEALGETENWRIQVWSPSVM